jgi:hypothetical protein
LSLGAVVGAEHDRVERVVVAPGQGSGAVGVFPDPVGESLVELAGFLLRGDRLGQVRDPLAVLEFIEDSDRALFEQ